MDLGMDPDRVLMVELRYPRVQQNPGESFAQWVERLGAIDRERHRVLIDVARRVPGVEKAAVAIGVPFFEASAVRLWMPGRDSIPELPGGGPYLAAVGTTISRRSARRFAADVRSPRPTAKAASLSSS